MSWIARTRLELELGVWRRRGHKPRLWWRDDDARQPTPQLDRLLAAAGALPLSLAIVPDGDLPALAKRLKAQSNVTVSQHGIDHQNRQPEGAGRRSEYPPGATQEEINAALARGRAAMIAAGLDPRFYTPTWNEYDDALLTAVRAAGYLTFSAGVKGFPAHGLKHLGADVDVLRWKGEPHFKGEGRILDLIRARLEARRSQRRYGAPIGILTHHLVHDEATWAFLTWFLEWSQTRFTWCDFHEATG